MSVLQGFEKALGDEPESAKAALASACARASEAWMTRGVSPSCSLLGEPRGSSAKEPWLEAPVVKRISPLPPVSRRSSLRLSLRRSVSEERSSPSLDRRELPASPPTPLPLA